MEKYKNDSRCKVIKTRNEGERILWSLIIKLNIGFYETTGAQLEHREIN